MYCIGDCTLQMSTKIIKASAAEPDVFETSISQALVELETNSDLKAQLRELYITKAKEIELHNKKVRTLQLKLLRTKTFSLLGHYFHVLPTCKVILKAQPPCVVLQWLTCSYSIKLHVLIPQTTFERCITSISSICSL